MATQTLGALAPNPKNPRTITDAKKSMLAKSLKKFGDLSGIVFNQKSKQLVGGHQRSTLLAADSVVTITKRYEKPTPTGTIAEGFVQVGKERFSYREVSWDAPTEKAANLAANKGAGEWDMSGLVDWMKDLEAIDFDLDLTMFDENERAALLQQMVEAKAV